MTLPLKNMDDQLTHTPTPHPPRNKQSNQQQKNKNSKKQTTTTHNNNNNNKQTTTTTTKQQILSTFNLFDCIVFCVLCWLFTTFYFVVFFLLSSVYFVAVDETNQTWTEWWKDKRCSSEQDKNWPSLDDSTVPLWPSTAFSCTIAQSHSLTVNSLQLDDSTVPLWPSTAFSLTIAQSHSDRQQPSAWR